MFLFLLSPSVFFSKIDQIHLYGKAVELAGFSRGLVREKWLAHPCLNGPEHQYFTDADEPLTCGSGIPNFEPAFCPEREHNPQVPSVP